MKFNCNGERVQENMRIRGKKIWDQFAKLEEDKVEALPEAEKTAQEEAE